MFHYFCEIIKIFYMKKTLLFGLTLFFSFHYSQLTKNVFFVGNSYTHTNDLPTLIKQIANSTGDNLNHQSHTPGGSTLQQHAGNTAVTGVIAQGNWDYVVLQEQSQTPAFPNNYVNQMMFPFATQLANAVKNGNPCGNPIFFMTWGYKNGDAINCNGGLTNMCTYQGMDDTIYQRYVQMAQTNEALLSPVGRVWRNIINNYPNMDLYSPDFSHPSYLGSMAAAYTFYTVIFKKDPTLATFNGTLSTTEASILKNAVKTVVFNQMDTWYINSNDANSYFTYQETTPQTVQFTNQTQNATTYLWNFGDGTTSTQQNPTHTYQNAGNYQVSLTTNACATNSTKTKTVNVTTLGTEEVNKLKFKIYPNPTSDLLFIDSKDKISDFKIVDMSGRAVSVNLKTSDSGYTTSLHHLLKGIYIVQFNLNGKAYTEKIHKN